MKNKKLKEFILQVVKEVVEEDEELDEITTTAATPGYSTPMAFSKKGRKKKKKNMDEAIEQSDMGILKSLIRSEVATILRDIWLKRSSWKK